MLDAGQCQEEPPLAGAGGSLQYRDLPELLSRDAFFYGREEALSIPGGSRGMPRRGITVAGYFRGMPGELIPGAYAELKFDSHG